MESSGKTSKMTNHLLLRYLKPEASTNDFRSTKSKLGFEFVHGVLMRVVVLMSISKKLKPKFVLKGYFGLCHIVIGVDQKWDMVKRYLINFYSQGKKEFFGGDGFCNTIRMVEKITAVNVEKE
ncbi:hypothetical protein LXL04_013228 [Taraxacum kok-saghyz]